MSWDGYIDNLIAQSGNNSDKACIIGMDGGAMWTTAAHAKGMRLSPAEGQRIAQCFKSRDYTAFMTGGVVCEGIKYQFLRQDMDMVLAKKKDQGALTLGASKTAIVIAHTAEGSQQGNTNKAVGVIADYLKSMNM